MPNVTSRYKLAASSHTIYTTEIVFPFSLTGNQSSMEEQKFGMSIAKVHNARTYNDIYIKRKIENELSISQQLADFAGNITSNVSFAFGQNFQLSTYGCKAHTAHDESIYMYNR